MKNLLVVAGIFAAFLATSTLAGERVVCLLYFTDGGVVAQGTDAPLATATADGRACPTNRLQPDGGILNWDGGYELSTAEGAGADGGLAGCAYCDWGAVRTLALQCDNPVYYSEKWDGGVTRWGQKGVVAAASTDMVIDFDINPDPYRIDLRGQSQHISVKPVSASSNTCRISTIQRHTP